MVTTKRWWLRIHIWLGISIGILWTLQGLTGALLVFNRDLLQGTAYAADAPSRALLPLDAIFAKASQSAHAPVTKIEGFGARPWLLLAYYDAAPGGERTLIVDGRTGAILGDRSTEALLPHGSGFWPWLLRLHEGLLGGERGQWITGISGMILFSSLVIGLWNAWPRRRYWRDAFRFRRWRTTNQKLLGWHRMLGLIFVLPLFVSSLGGTYLAFAPALRPVLADHAGYQLVYKPKPLGQAPAVTVTTQQAWQAAQARFPGSQLVRATIPTAKSPVYFFRLLQPGEWRRWAGTTTVAVDPRTGAVVDAYDALAGPGINRATDNIYALHTGEAGGVGTRFLILLGGLALPTFFLTGLLSWRRRRRAKLRTRPA
jgi:uncharacterized iron-regulated membrane protein